MTIARKRKSQLDALREEYAPDKETHNGILYKYWMSKRENPDYVMVKLIKELKEVDEMMAEEKIIC